MKYLRLNDIDCYRRSLRLSNYIWNIIKHWEWFTQKTIGEQFVKAADSISANIAEGFGRYGKRDKIKFYHYSLGSLKEVHDWTEKARRRKVITADQYLYIFQDLSLLPKEINQLIQFTNERLKF